MDNPALFGGKFIKKNQSIHQLTNKSNTFKFFYDCPKILINNIEKHKKAYYILFLLTPLVTETFSAAYNLINFNTSIKKWTGYSPSLNVIALIAIITFLLINSATFYYVSIQPQEEKYKIEKDYWNNDDNNQVDHQTRSAAFKIGAGLGYLIIIPSIGFYAWTTGKTAYNMIDQIPDGKWCGLKHATAYLSGVLCGVGAIMATLITLIKISETLGTFNDIITTTISQKWSKFYNDRVSPLKCNPVIKFLFLPILVISAIFSTFCKFIYEKKPLSIIKEKIEQKKTEIKLIYQKKKEMPIIFILAASFFLVDCFITGAGVGLSIHYFIESKKLHIFPEFLLFHESFPWILPSGVGLLAILGQAYFYNYQQCIGRIMENLCNLLIKPSESPQTEREAWESIQFSSYPVWF